MIIKIYNYDTDAFTEFEKDELDDRSDYAFAYDTLLDYDFPDWFFTQVLYGVSMFTYPVDITIKLKGISYTYTILKASKK